MTIHTIGEHKGVPFKILYDELPNWDLVNPRCCMPDGGVFLGFGLDMSQYTHINYGAKHVEFAVKHLYALLEKHHDRIVRNARKDLGAKRWAEEISGHGVSDCAAELKIQSDVRQALDDGNIEALAKYLDYAQVDYITKDLKGSSQGEHCQTIYFKEDGSKIKAKERTFYSGLIQEIDNWVWGNIYQVEIPLDSAGGFVDERFPENNPECNARIFIEEEIDELLARTSGNYMVEADRAFLGKEGQLEFDPTDKLHIFVDTMKEAKIINGWFEGNALIENLSKKQSRQRD